MTIRLLLVDDHRMFREALAAPLNAEPDMEVIGEASSGDEALNVIGTLCPDVAIIDIGMRDMTGIELVRKLSKLWPSVRCVALSGHCEKLYVEEMLKSGAHGYVVKASGSAELIAAIRAVTSGHTFLSPEVTKLFTRCSRHEEHTPPPSVLSRREVELLCLLSSGKRSAEIAEKMGITIATVEVHRRNIRQKLNINTVAELTAYAIREGLITP